MTYLTQGMYICSDTVKLTVYKAEMKSLKFTSDHGLLRNNTTDWSDSGDLYQKPEWIPDGPDPGTQPERNNPISHTKNVKLTVELTLQVAPPGWTFNLTGDGPDSYVDFTKNGLTSTGVDQQVTIEPTGNLPDQVCVLEKTISWTATLVTPEPDIEVPMPNSGPHKIYVTHGTPSGSGVTEKRIIWVCQSAAGRTSAKDVADGIHVALNANPPIDGSGGTQSDDWVLLGGSPYRGQCDEQARFMVRALAMIGSSGVSYLTMASRDSANVEDLEWCVVEGKKYYMSFDFDNDGWVDNRFEGSVSSASHYYAVWPSLNAPSKCRLLKQVGPDYQGAAQRFAQHVNDDFWGMPPTGVQLPEPVAYPSCP